MKYLNKKIKKIYIFNLTYINEINYILHITI